MAGCEICYPLYGKAGLKQVCFVNYSSILCHFLIRLRLKVIVLYTLARFLAKLFIIFKPSMHFPDMNLLCLKGLDSVLQDGYRFLTVKSSHLLNGNIQPASQLLASWQTTSTPSVKPQSFVFKCGHSSNTFSVPTQPTSS